MKTIILASLIVLLAAACTVAERPAASPADKALRQNNYVGSDA